METLFLLDDGEEVWRRLAEEAKQGGHKIVTAGHAGRGRSAYHACA